MANPQWLIIARREFLERVRTKWFVIVTLLGPVGMAAILVLPVWLSVRSSKEAVRIQVVDQTDAGLGAQLTSAVNALGSSLVLEDVSGPPVPATDDLRGRIRRDEIDGFLVLPADTFEGGTVRYHGVNATSIAVVNAIRAVIDFAVRDVKLVRANVDPETRLAVALPTRFEAYQDMGEAEATSGQASSFVGYAVMFILYMAILLYAVNVLRSVVQEKTSRVVEIMVSAVKPHALMLGKILGVGAVGLFQLTIWAIIALLLIRYREQVLGLFGVDGAGAVEVPSVDAVSLVIALTFFLLGYFFYAALYAAIGATVNSEQEAQQAQTPVVLLLVIPVVCAQLVASNPRGAIAEVFTIVPFSSPVLMPLRYLLGGATTADLAISIGVLVLSTALVTWLAARIYRVGILMYGKKPSLREVGRWLKYK
jgi:ABC-2 type transport system permease protein